MTGEDHCVLYVDIHKGKNKVVARNEKWKKQHWGFHIYEIWQILKCFAGSFHQA